MSLATGRRPARFLDRPKPHRHRVPQSHLAFAAPSRAAVRDFFAAAAGTGAEVLYEPRLWPEYHASYYGAFVRDPDGNNVEAVCHLPGD